MPATRLSKAFLAYIAFGLPRATGSLAPPLDMFAPCCTCIGFPSKFNSPSREVQGGASVSVAAAQRPRGSMGSHCARLDLSAAQPPLLEANREILP